jgi:hypothetical protein
MYVRCTLQLNKTCFEKVQTLENTMGHTVICRCLKHSSPWHILFRKNNDTRDANFSCLRYIYIHLLITRGRQVLQAGLLVTL